MFIRDSPLVDRPNLDVGCQQITGRAAGGDVQAQARQFAPHVGAGEVQPVSYKHLRAHETVLDLVCRLLLEKKTG